VEALTPDDEATPGETGRYRFRLTNMADVTVTIAPIATNSHDGWSSELYAADGITRLADRMTIAPGQAVEVIVKVTVPADARAGDTNTTSLDVTRVVEPSPRAEPMPPPSA
jgi:uncharacterized membrane protein